MYITYIYIYYISLNCLGVWFREANYFGVVGESN